MKLKKSCSLFKVFQLMYRKNGFIKISMLTLLIREALIGHFTVVYLVAKPLIWSEAEGDLVVLETRI